LAWDWDFWRRLLVQAYPLALANLFAIIYFRIDTVMLASLDGQRAVGLYNAAYRLLEFTLIVPAYYNGALFPVISASRTTHPQRFLLIYRRSVKYMLIAAVPMALGASALAPGFIETLYGAAYLDSVPVLSVLMWTLVLIAVNSLNAPYLIVMGRQRIVTALLFVGMVLNIAFNFYAIPHYGMLGAAWVTFLGEIVIYLLFLWALRKPLDLNLRMLRYAVPPLAAGGLMYLVLRQVPHWDLGFQVVLGAVLYLGLLFAFRAFDEVDQELFSRVLRPTWFGGIKLT
jgi:O-antigen/teichoic acid export membrane protein